MNELTFTEEMTMMVLWSLQSGYLKDILEAYPEPKPHQNTVSTYLKILEEKKFITAEKEGRIHNYQVAISYDDYQTDRIESFLQQHFSNNPVNLVQKMISDSVLKTEDLQNFLNLKINVIPPKEKTEGKKEESAVADFIKTLIEPKIRKKKKKKKKKKNQ